MNPGLSLRPRRRIACVALFGALAAPALFAQGAFPTKSITWLVGYPPGGSVDVSTRVVAKKMEAALGQAVVVENRPGATGLIALQAAAHAAPDGYTLITVPGPVLSNVPQPQVGKELTGVATLAKGPMVLVGPAATALPTLKDLLEAMRKNPGKYSFASSGNGTSQHLAGELINQMGHVKMVHVPYKGGGQAITDVVGGQVPLAVLGITPVLPHVKSGRLKAYGVSTATRSPALPDVPTLAEAGLPGFEASQWFVVAAPAGVPADRLQKLNAGIDEALRQPDVVAAFSNVGVEPAITSPQQTTAFVEGDLARWRELALKAKLPLD